MQKKTLKPKVVDTCALISLSVSGFLEECIELNIIIPRKIKEELGDISQYPDLDGKHARNVLGFVPDRIRMVDIRNKERVSHLMKTYPNIDAGEAEILVLAEEQEGIVITDDLRCLSELKENSKVPIYLSVYLFAGLILDGLVGRDDVLDAIDDLAKKRDWKHSALYTYSREYIRNL